MMTDEIKTIFLQFLVDRIPIKAFEQWLYSTPELEQMMNCDDYFSLLAIDFNNKFAFRNIYNIIQKYISLDEFVKFKFSILLHDIIEHNEYSPSAIEETYYLYCDGYEFLEKLGLCYGEFLTLFEYSNQQDVDNMYPQIIEDARQVLQWFNTSKIVFIEKKKYDSLYGYEYKDFR